MLYKTMSISLWCVINIFAPKMQKRVWNSWNSTVDSSRNVNSKATGKGTMGDENETGSGHTMFPAIVTEGGVYDKFCKDK